MVICAYCGYKGLDNYALYANEILGYDEVESARITSLAAYLRPVAAIIAGFIVDRYSASRIITILFAVLLICYGCLSLLSATTQTLVLIYSNLVITFLAVFAIRGVYFALLQETHINKQTTGTAVGLISVVGFTPDIFFASLSGRLLDASPGLTGHQHFFLLLTAIASIGMLAAWKLSVLSRQENLRGWKLS